MKFSGKVIVRGKTFRVKGNKRLPYVNLRTMRMVKRRPKQ